MTGTTKTTATLNSQSSKAEEIAVLKAWQAQAGEQTYLSSLLSPQMVAHVESAIKNDMMCDVKADLEYWSGQANEQRVRYEESQAALAKAQQANDALKLSLEAERQAVANAKAEAAAVQSRTRNYINSILERMEEAEDQNTKDAQTILELKARLFDLLVK